MKTLQEMSVLVTGGGSGIGAGTAEYLTQRGARVTICGRRADKVEAVAERLGDACLAVSGDITNADDRPAHCFSRGGPRRRSTRPGEQRR